LDFFGQSVSVFFGFFVLYHVLAAARRPWSYFGKDYDPQGLFKNDLYFWCGATLLVYCCVQLIVGGGLPHALYIYFYLRYVHIERRYESLSRGAGAVGIVPVQIAFLVVCLETVNWFELDPMWTRIALYFYFIRAGIMMVESGLYKCIFGYAKNSGIQFALSNPIWARFYSWRFIRGKRLSSLLNNTAWFLQIVCGLLLILVPYNYAGFILFSLFSLFIFLVFDLSSLGILLILIPFMGISIGINPFSLNARFPENLVLNDLSVFASKCMNEPVIGFCAILGIIIFLFVMGLKYSVHCDLLGKKKYFSRLLDSQFARNIQYAIPVFPWRVFSSDITDVYPDVYIKSPKDSDWEELAVFSDRPWYVKVIPFSSFFWKTRFSYASEAIVLSTLVNGFKLNGLGVGDHFIRYCRSLMGMAGLTECDIRFDIWQLNLSDRYNVTKTLIGYVYFYGRGAQADVVVDQINDFTWKHKPSDRYLKSAKS